MGDLGETGQAVWVAFQAESLDGATQTLVRELCRTADTLDRLDDLVRGEREAWASLVFDGLGEVHLHVDKLLDERAKQQSIFKQVWGELRQSGVKPTAVPVAPGADEKADEPGDVLAALRRAKEERERQSGRAG